LWNKSMYTSTVLFLFSSRRRHTIFSRDWSSDVCSSDLLISPLQKLLLELVFLFGEVAVEVGDDAVHGRVDQVRGGEGVGPVLGEIGRAACREGVWRYADGRASARAMGAVEVDEGTRRVA